MKFRIESNQTHEWIVKWTPTRLGEINVTAKVFNKTFNKNSTYWILCL